MENGGDDAFLISTSCAKPLGHWRFWIHDGHQRRASGVIGTVRAEPLSAVKGSSCANYCAHGRSRLAGTPCRPVAARTALTMARANAFSAATPAKVRASVALFAMPILPASVAP